MASPVMAMDLAAFRDRWPLRPHQIVTWHGLQVEVISFPWPVGDGAAAIYIRTTPDDPTTLMAVNTADLKP